MSPKIKKKVRKNTRARTCRLNKLRPVPGTARWMRGSSHRVDANAAAAEVRSYVATHGGTATTRQIYRDIRSNPNSVMAGELEPNPVLAAERYWISQTAAMMRSLRCVFTGGGDEVVAPVVTSVFVEMPDENSRMRRIWVRAVTERVMADVDLAHQVLANNTTSIDRLVDKQDRNLQMITMEGCRRVHLSVANMNRIHNILASDGRTLWAIRP